MWHFGWFSNTVFCYYVEKLFLDEFAPWRKVPWNVAKGPIFLIFFRSSFISCNWRIGACPAWNAAKRGSHCPQNVLWGLVGTYPKSAHEIQVHMGENPTISLILHLSEISKFSSACFIKRTRYWAYAYLSASFIERTFYWAHSLLSACFIERTLYWVHALLSARFIDSTLYWAHASLSALFIECMLYWAHA